MKRDEEYIVDTLSRIDCLYLSGKGNCEKKFEEVSSEKDKIKTEFLAMYRIDEITYEEKAPRKEALENVISSMDISGVNFVYLIKGDSTGVSFYYGVARDYSAEEPQMAINDIGELILKPSLQGNYRGSKIIALNPNEKKELLLSIDEMKDSMILEGVPGINKDDEDFQSVDRIIDVMMGNKFALMIIAKPLTQESILLMQNKMYQLYDSISPISKSSIQESSGISEGTSSSTSKNKSTTEGTNSSKAEQEGSGTSESKTKGTSSGTSKSTSKGTSDNFQNTQSGTEGSSTGKNTSEQTGKSTSSSTTKSEGTSTSGTIGTSESKGVNRGKNTGNATTLEIVNKKVQEWIKYLDDVIFPRVDYGTGKGLFVSTAILMGEHKASLIKLENTIRSIYGGESGNRMPLKAFEIANNEKSYVNRMQIPIITFDKELSDNEENIRTVCSQYIRNKKTANLGSWMSSKELSLFAGLPQKEVVGLALREEVEFGLNIREIPRKPVTLGHLVQSGVVLNGKNGVSKIPVSLEKEYFDKHIFVTGVTGSGKTTTCQKLLLDGNENFMVIEPAKTEYRILKESKFSDMLVFTLGRETGAPFRLNPFEFFPGESITSRVDMIKASMEAAFDMEAAIPQILETAIYKCYEDKGWDISNDKNRIYGESAFDDGVFAFPTLGDLYAEIPDVVEKEGFNERLRDDYIGSIKARLKGLMVGAKGMMLDTPRSVDFVDLLSKNVVLELENIKSASEKSLIMGFILSNLSEAIKLKYRMNGGKQLEHITLIEEAHRLLSKYMPGDSMNKKQGVEMFSDMLAEVRKYGESLIIADQIPNKLTPEVLKNTNTKIVHKIFAQDDKDAIGNTMALKDEQKEHLSYLEAGSAIMMHPGLSKAIQVKIEQTEMNDTGRVPPEDDALRSGCMEYYSSAYKRMFPGMSQLEKKPSKEQIEVYMNYFAHNSSFVKSYIRFVFYNEYSNEVADKLEQIVQSIKVEGTVQIIKYVIYDIQNKSVQSPEFDKYLADFIKNLIANKENIILSKVKGKDYLELIKRRN